MKKSFYMIFGLAILIRLLWSFMRWDFLQVTIYDDAFYYFTVAKHIMAGMGITADGITKTNGFHPLWMAIILPLFYKGFNAIISLRLVMLLAMIFDIGAGYLIFKILRKLHDENIGLLGAGLYLFNPVVITQSMSGMETPLVAFMVLLWVWIVFKTDYKYFEIGIVAGLLCMARTDMIFIVIAGLIYLWLSKKENKVQLFWIFPIFLAIISPWFIWNYKTFGTFLQESGSAYPWIFHNEWTQWYHHDYFSWNTIVRLVDLTKTSFTSMSAYFGGWPILTLCLVILGINNWGNNKSRWFFLGSLIIVLIHTYIRWFPRIWYFHVPYIAFLLLLAPMLYKIKYINKIILIGLFALGMLVVISDDTTDHIGSFRKAYLTQKRAIVATNLINCFKPGTLVGAWNSGYPSYFADSAVVVNLDGLANNSIMPYYENSKFGFYCDSIGIKYIVDNPYFMDWSYGKYFEKTFRDSIQVLIRIDSIGTPENSMAIFKLPYKPLKSIVQGDSR